LNAKKVSHEDHEATLEEIGMREKVLIMMRKHHLVMHSGMGERQKKRMAATVVIKSRILTSLE
jgi:hypothetical protein